MPDVKGEARFSTLKEVLFLVETMVKPDLTNRRRWLGVSRMPTNGKSPFDVSSV